MAVISSQSTRSSGRAQNYAKKDAVAISASNATVPGFERRLQEIRRAHKSKNVQAYSLVQSFGHDELDPSDPESWTRANTLGRAVAEERFPGHPVLVATEINGRSGCVHNHLIVGAVNPETGMSIDSNLVTHSRLALAHDQVLTANGFAQREDMARITEAATAEVEARRQAAMAEDGFDELSPSQQNRRLTAAENSVRLESRDTSTASQKRDAKRRRELIRYEQNEQDREIALELGITPPAEKFSEFELEGRIRKTLNDPRATSWESVVEIGRENLVTIDQRGKEDITYGMMLAQPDGTIAEPARSHRRRGGIEGAKSPGLGEGFRRGDVEKAIDGNVALQAETARSQAEADQRRADQQARLEREEEERQRLIAERLAERKTKSTETDTEINAEVADLQARFSKHGEAQQTSVAEQPEPEATTVQAADKAELADDGKTVDEAGTESPVSEPTELEIAEPTFRSRLRDHRFRDEKQSTQYEAAAQLEEDYRGRGPDAEFERRAKATHLFGPKFLERHSDELSPEFREVIEARAAQGKKRSSFYEKHRELRKESDAISAGRKQVGYEESSRLTSGLTTTRKRVDELTAKQTAGDYFSDAREQGCSTKAFQQRADEINAKDPDYQDRQGRIAKARGDLVSDRVEAAGRYESQGNDNDGLG